MGLPKRFVGGGGPLKWVAGISVGCSIIMLQSYQSNKLAPPQIAKERYLMDEVWEMKNARLTVLFSLLLAAACPAQGQGITLSVKSRDGVLTLSNGAIFNVGESGQEAISLWAVGDKMSYTQGDGECPKKSFWLTDEAQKDMICVRAVHSERTLSSTAGRKDVTVQVVQTETAKQIVTQDSSYAQSTAAVLLKSMTSPNAAAEARGASVAGGTSVSEEVTKLVAEDVILNGQKVRLTCAFTLSFSHSSCHSLNPGEYQGQLKGDKLWITSYGMEWDKKAEKLTQQTFEERWKIVGAWQ